MGISLPDVRARQFVPEKDIVVFDMVVVMDKYTAADVLKEVPPWPAPGQSFACHAILYHSSPLTIQSCLQ